MKVTEKRKQILFALFAIAMLMGACQAFGQNVKARNFRDGSKEYNPKYFNISLITSLNGKVEQTDSVLIFIRERGATEAVMFTACEKTDLYLEYDKFYLISIAHRGYTTANLMINSGVVKKEYNDFIPIKLQSGNGAKSIGIVVWDSRINDIHYYPESGSFE